VTAISEQLPEMIVDEGRWHKLFIRKFEIGIVEAFKVLRSKNIEPILIKGWAAARNYPRDKFRFFEDVDLAFPASQYDLAREIITSNPTFLIAIDLHREFRHLDTVPWDTAFARSELINVDGGEIRILRPEDHFRVLCVHWLNDGGAYRDRLWDVYYAVENRPPDFDWEMCLDSVSATRRRWIETTIAIAAKYLLLNVEELPFKVGPHAIPDWITRCLEKEWETDVRLIPLEACVHQPRILIPQILKRLPPNPIEATIEMEGDFDDGWRLPYQIGSMRKRIGPSVKRVTPAVRSLLRK